MMSCERCGRPNEDEATFCLNCGKEFHPVLAQATDPVRLTPLGTADAKLGPDQVDLAGVGVKSSSDQRHPSGFGRVRVIDNDLYSENAQKTRRTLSKRLQAFIKDPNPDNVHDLRTAARRTRACLHLLPKSARSQRTRKYSARLNHLIRVNARIRDIDIMLSKIGKRKDSSVHEILVSRLVKQRAAELKPALRFASSLRKPARGLIRSENLSDERLQKRFDKVTTNLEDRIRRRLPKVLENPAKKRALHRLREDSRGLRYVLDLGGTPSEKEPMPLLRSWQDILGLIHDSDIMIDRLSRGRPSPEIQDLLRDEVTERNLNYEKFASMSPTRIVLRLSESHGRKAAKRLAR